MEHNEKIKFAGNIQVYSKQLLKDTKYKNDDESKVQCEIGIQLKKSIKLLAEIAGVPYGDNNAVVDVDIDNHTPTTAAKKKHKDTDESVSDESNSESE
jgi:hypothetical protein